MMKFLGKPDRLLRFFSKRIVYCLCFALFFACGNDEPVTPVDEDPGDEVDTAAYPGVPQSATYEVSLVSGSEKECLTVFHNACPAYELGKMNMEDKDKYPLEIFAGRSVNWTHFTLEGSVTVEVKVVDQQKVPPGQPKIFPSRRGVSAAIEGNTIRFQLSQPGQYSLEVGENGFKHALIIFADPPETDLPDTTSGYAILRKATASAVNSVPASFSGIYFKEGVHDIGVYRVPANIKNIYFEPGSWVYGSLIMDGRPGVKIFGRGVLSSGKLNYRQSHCIEAINQSDNITIDGIVVADPKYFAVRLIGQNNVVKWTKVIGGWVYNCDGIAAYAGSTVSNCFIWANDDAIKVYRDNITWSDIVVWQLNNGGVIQMAWGGSNATNVKISRVDVLRAEWNKPAFNRGLINCVGNRYQEPGKTGLQQDWLIEDVKTENPIPVIFNIAPDPFSPNHIHNLTLKNWNVHMSMNTSYQNSIIGNDPGEYFDGFVFDNFLFNGVRLTQENWRETTAVATQNLVTPTVQ